MPPDEFAKQRSVRDDPQGVTIAPSLFLELERPRLQVLWQLAAGDRVEGDHGFVESRHRPPSLRVSLLIPSTVEGIYKLPQTPGSAGRQSRDGRVRDGRERHECTAG
jgi:hypothetical protein